MKLRNSLRPIAIRTVDLGQPLPALTEVQDYPTVRVFVAWNGRPLGSVDIANRRQSISAAPCVKRLLTASFSNYSNRAVI